MRAEVIAIGDELTSGVRVDTNSAWLSQQLEQLGVPVGHHTTVGDDLEAIVDVLQIALRRANVVVVSGGLGPTADDLTRQALATALDRPLERNESVLQHLRALFAQRGREMPPRNVVQAEFPAGSDVIANPHGTAPGIHMIVQDSAEREARHIFALPGVPAELKQMWNESVEPQLRERKGTVQNVIRHRIIRCFGAGESDIEQRLPDLVRRGRQPTVGITASEATISLRVTAAGQTPSACLESMTPTVATIYECLGTLIFGEGDDTLQDVVGRLLEQQQWMLASVEWNTQGLLAHWLTTATGDDTYRGGLVVHNILALDEVLGIPPETVLLGHGRQLAEEMARCVRCRLKADLGLAVGPCATEELLGDQPQHVHFALATPGEVVHGDMVFNAHPSIQLQRAAKGALNLTRLWLLNQPL